MIILKFAKFTDSTLLICHKYSTQSDHSSREWIFKSPKMFSKWPNFGYFFPIYGLIKIVINIFSFWLREVNQLVRCLTLKQSLHSHMLKEVALLVFTSYNCTTVIYSKIVTKTFNTICKSNLSTNQVYANKIQIIS